MSLGISLSKPLQISFQTSLRCNARCLTCHSWHEQKDYLSADEILNCLRDLKKWLGNSTSLFFTGGEALIFDGIYDILTYCTEQNIMSRLQTNGISLDENNLNRIIESGLKYLTISLDSHLIEVHDRFRGVPGTFETINKAIYYLSEKSDINIGIACLIMKDNIEHLSESLDYFMSLPVQRITFQPIRLWTQETSIEHWADYEYWVKDIALLKKFTDYLLSQKMPPPRSKSGEGISPHIYGGGRGGKQKIVNTKRDTQEWLDYFQNPTTMVSKNKKRCGIGFDRLKIDYLGNITFGCELFEPIGNIKKDNIQKAWYSSKARSIRKQMMNCTYPCTSNCYKEMNLLQKIKAGMRYIKRSG